MASKRTFTAQNRNIGPHELGGWTTTTPGLVIAKVEPTGRWRIFHEPSGLAVYESWRLRADAAHAAELLSDLADWTLEAWEVVVPGLVEKTKQAVSGWYLDCLARDARKLEEKRKVA